MKVLVGIKLVADYTANIRISADALGLQYNNIKMSMNPFCEVAVEQAVRLKSENIATETIALSIGPKGCIDILRTAMAMGIDRAIHIETMARTDFDLQPLSIAKIICRVVRRENTNLVILGKQSIDGENSQTGPMLAGILGWSQGICVTSMAFRDHGIIIEQEADRGTEKLFLPLPAVVTADLRLNQPRLPSLMNVMKAKKKQVETLTVVDLGLSQAVLAGRNHVVRLESPPPRPSGKILKDVDELIAQLRTDGLLT